MTVEVRRAGDRFLTRTDGVESWHSLSFGRHYDPSNTSFGPLVAHNDERLAAGAGFAPHPHRDLEIVTWVVEGALLYEDDHGHRGTPSPGVVQRLSAGRGVVHSERCADTTRFVQAWLVPDSAGGEVRYDTAMVAPAELHNRLTKVAGSGGGLPLRCRGAELLAGRLENGITVEMPAAAYRHVFVTLGRARLGTGQMLATGDAARLTAGDDLSVTADGPCELLVWVMQATATTGES